MAAYFFSMINQLVMKKLIVAMLGLIMVLASCSESHQTEYTISGTGLNQYNGDSIKIYVADTTVDRGHYTECALIENGAFTLHGNVSNPRSIYLTIYDKENIYKGWKYSLILQSGTIDMAFAENGKDAEVSGASYNKIINSDIANDSAIKEANTKVSSLLKSLNGKEWAAWSKAEQEAYQSLTATSKRLTNKAYQTLYDNHQDALVRLFAMQKLRAFSNWEEDLKKIEEEIGAIDELVILRHSIIASEKATANKVIINVGDFVKEFSAKDLNNEEFHLSEVLAKNDYVLVEFWASWCAPCRAEIPHMKKAYEDFHNKGFEIVSFTLDHKLNAWQKATTEESITWINVSDLKAHSSPVVKMYGVAGVPANYLVNKNGEIIAMHLRGEALDTKLNELLGE